MVLFLPACRSELRHTRPLPRSLALLLVVLLPAFVIPAAEAETPAQGTEMRSPLSIQGYVSGKYVSRRSKADDTILRDEDAFGELRLDIARPSAEGAEFHYFGALRDELSKHVEKSTYSLYEDVGNSYRSRMRGITYEAHLDLNRPFGSVHQIRLGRQDGMRDEPVFFDGIAVDLGMGEGVRATVYGGAAVHFFEIDNRWGADRLGGLGIDIALPPGSSASLDYLYTDDRWNLFNDVNQHDYLVSLRLLHRFSPFVKVTAKGRYLNDDPRDATLRMSAELPAADLEVLAAYFRQFRTQQVLSTELSSFSGVVGQTLPYQTAEGKLRKFLGSRAAMDLGYFERTLVNPEQQGIFNRSFRRAYAVLDIMDVVFRGLTLSFTGERWYSAERSFRSSGFDAGYAFKRQRRNARVNIGYYASLYKYDDFTSLGERTNTRTSYAKVEIPLWQAYSLNGAYEFEHGLQDYQTARLGVRYDF